MLSCDWTSLWQRGGGGGQDDTVDGGDGKKKKESRRVARHENRGGCTATDVDETTPALPACVPTPGAIANVRLLACVGEG